MRPRCPSGEACEYRVFLEEYEKVDREYERQLVRNCAELRMEVNVLSAQVEALRDPEEKREDGERVRKDRWETACRNIAGILYGSRGSWELGDLVERVRELAGKNR